MIERFRFFIMSSIVALTAPSGAWAQSCAPGPVTVQILGSGGPAINRERASTSYLLWVGGQARMLLDIGGGTYQRFGLSQAKLSDLALVAISHLHPDHVSDLPALLWVSQAARAEPLPIIGPSGNSLAGPNGNDVGPDFSTFLARLFDEKNGAFPAMGGTLGGRGNGVRLNVSVVDVTKAAPSTVFEGQGLTVTALGIPHANMPTLAYRVQTSGVSVVFSSDQNGTNPKFIDFAKGADVLVMHLAIAANAPPSPLHASPAVVGRIAQDASPKRLILSHIGQFDLETAIVDVKKSYTGALTVGADLQCTPVQ